MGVFSLHLLRPSVPNVELPPVKLVRRPSTTVLRDRFVAGFPTTVNKTIVCRGRLPILMALHLRTLRAIPRVQMGVVSQRGSQCGQFSYLRPSPSALLFSAPLHFFVGPSNRNMTTMKGHHHRPNFFTNLQVRRGIPTMFFRFLPRDLLCFFVLPIPSLRRGVTSVTRVTTFYHATRLKRVALRVFRRHITIPRAIRLSKIRNRVLSTTTPLRVMMVSIYSVYHLVNALYRLMNSQSVLVRLTRQMTRTLGRYALVRLNKNNRLRTLLVRSTTRTFLPTRSLRYFRALYKRKLRQLTLRRLFGATN